MLSLPLLSRYESLSSYPVFDCLITNLLISNSETFTVLTKEMRLIELSSVALKPITCND